MELMKELVLKIIKRWLRFIIVWF